MGVVVIGDRTRRWRLSSGIIQSLIEASINLRHEPMPVNRVNSSHDTDVHGPDDHRGDHSHSGGMDGDGTSPRRWNLHVAANPFPRD
jgi:hypothetical protein